MTVLCVGGAHVDRRLRLAAGVRLERGQSMPVSSQEQPGGVAANCARALASAGADVQLRSLGSDCAYTLIESAAGDVLYGFADMAVYDRLDDAWLAAQLADSPAGGFSALVVDANCALTRPPAFAGPIFLLGVSPAKMSRLLPLCPVAGGLFCNRAEWQALQALHPDGSLPPLRLVTEGARGAELSSPDQPQPRRIAPLLQAPRSTNGLGDRLAGYVIARLLSGQKPLTAVTQAMEHLHADNR